MPNTAPSQSRFDKSRTVTRATRFAKTPVAAGAKPTTQTKPQTDRQRPRKSRNAADLKTDIAAKTAAHDLTPAEHERRTLIRDRNRRRRYPWIPPAGLLGIGQLTHWISILLGGTATTTALTAATIPLTTAIGVLLYHRKTHLHWWRELIGTGLGGAMITGWIAVAGITWYAVLALLAGTVAGGTRWWKAHPIGPGVPPLEPTQPQPPSTETTPEEIDPYCVAWQNNNADLKGDGKAKGSQLTNLRLDEFTRTYDIELKRGSQTVKNLLANREDLAGGLGEDTERVLFKRAPRGSGAHMAVLTIITKDPTEEVRYYTRPRVERGIIKGVARFTDGSGEIAITMWDKSGTVPTMVVGGTGSGKSAAANILTTSAMSTGIMNLLYVDPKGNSSTAIASRARVSIVGKANALLAPYLVQAMTEARGELASRMQADLILPSVKIPGWMFLHDEYSLIANDAFCTKVWTETVNIIRAYGIWGVALNQSQGQPQWGNDHARAAFASQVVAFRVNSKSGSDLVPGLSFDPANLPVDEEGRPVPGMAVHANYDTPTRWDYLPSDADAEEMIERGEAPPPCTTSQIFDRYFNQPTIHPVDEQAIVSILGPAIDGRWQVGGFGATHEFRPDVRELSQGNSQQAAASWGQIDDIPAPVTVDQLNPTQAEVLQIVRSGTAAAGDIVNSANATKSSVYEALKTLVGAGLIDKTKHGTYVAGLTND